MKCRRRGQNRGRNSLARRRSVRAAFEAGADGVVLAREYVEMRLANLSAAGERLRRVFAVR